MKAPSSICFRRATSVFYRPHRGPTCGFLLLWPKIAIQPSSLFYLQLRVTSYLQLRGDLLYVFPCVILFLCFSVLLVLRLPRLGKSELILVLFVRLFDLCLFGFVGFLFLLGSGRGCGLWLWHSLGFSLTFFSLTYSGVTFLAQGTSSVRPDPKDVALFPCHRCK